MNVSPSRQSGNDRDKPVNPLWISEMEWGVPLLRLDRQADRIEAPFSRWGRGVRKSRMRGTWHFYTDDSRFEALWSRPYHVTNSACEAAVECNYSVHGQTARAVALWNTYRKRWLARYWQEAGVRVIVDLNVAPEHARLNMLGVPRGWSAWATRGAKDEIDLIESQYELAKEWGETRLFVVYGGGRRVGDWCELRGALWVREEQDTVPRG